MSNPFALIVDDHVDSAIICAEAFKAAGFGAEITHSAEEALEWLAATTPDVVILDLCLPRVAGTDILRQIRADARLAATHVIVFSADPLFAASLQGQVELVLVKPVSFTQLRDLAMRLGSNASPEE